MERSYFSIEKFQVVMKELDERGWRRSNALVIDYNCDLIWLNYVNIKFKNLENNYVNHIKGAKHLSNKVNFAFK